MRCERLDEEARGRRDDDLPGVRLRALLRGAERLDRVAGEHVHDLEMHRYAYFIKKCAKNTRILQKYAKNTRIL